MPTTRVLLFSGQSNMVGAALARNIPDRARPARDGVRLFEEGKFRTLPWRETFGPEIGFSAALSETALDTPVVIAKCARDSSNLYSDWAPEGLRRPSEDEDRGPLYPVMLAQWRRLEALLSESGELPQPAGLIWMQGERDASFATMAEQYAVNLAHLIERIRTDTRTPDLPVVIGRISPRMIDVATGRRKHPHYQEVRDAQERVAGELDNVALVETIDLPQFDNLHFDAAGQVELGRRFAHAWRRLAEPVPA